jgi:mRNA interferase RelE/StbE
MDSYDIGFKPSVQKDLRALSKDILPRILARIEGLRQNPIGSQVAKLSGAEHLYRLRVGDYHVVFAVDKASKRVIVQHVRHRREVYRGM